MYSLISTTSIQVIPMVEFRLGYSDTTLLQLTLVPYVHAKKLGSWTISRHFSLSFASIIASSNVWKYFSLKSISFSSGLVVVVDGVIVVVVVEDGMMVCWAEMSGTPGLGLKGFSPVNKLRLYWRYTISFYEKIHIDVRFSKSLFKTQRKV